MVRLSRLLFAVLFVIGMVSFVEAKPPGGGFRSSSSSFKSSSGSGWGTRSSSSSTKSGWGTKSSATPSTKASTSTSWSTSRPAAKETAAKPAVDTAAYKKAKESGKAFATPKAAEADFKAKNAAKYTSSYKSEPSSRPSHIPASTAVGGKTVSVTYNAGYGGYGYMHPTLGTWMMYDMMSDAVMMSAVMRNDGYHVGPAPVHTASSIGWCVLASILLLFIAVVIFSGLNA